MFKNYKKLYLEQKRENEHHEKMYLQMIRFLHDSTHVIHSTSHLLARFEREERIGAKQKMVVQDIKQNFSLLKRMYAILRRGLREDSESVKRDIDFAELLLSTIAYFKLKYRNDRINFQLNANERSLVYCDDAEIENILILVVDTFIRSSEMRNREGIDIEIESKKVDNSFNITLQTKSINRSNSDFRIEEIQETAKAIIVNSHNGIYNLDINPNEMKFTFSLPIKY